MEKNKKIKVLLVDDSIVVRNILKDILDSDSEISIIGEAENGKRAIELTKKLNPDIITMDIQMPEMDGYEAVEYIMAYHPTPIIVFSSLINKTELNASIKAISLGALDVISKPDVTDDQFEQISNLIISKVKSLSKIKVISHIHGKLRKGNQTNNQNQKIEQERDQQNLKNSIQFQPITQYQMIAIGASTGGPVALETLLSEFPADFPIPIVIVQHICDGFIESLVELLNSRLELEVKVAEDRETVIGGRVYFAPNNTQMIIEKSGKILLDKTLPPWGVFKPSVNYLFNSIAENIGDKGIGIVLTGMGNDGSEGIEKMYKKKCFTIAQDQNSSLIFGMPKAAIDKDAISIVLPLTEIAHEIKNITGYNNG